MKNLIMAVLLIPAITWGQIEVDEYPIELKCDIDMLHTLPGVTAHSSCGEVEVQMTEQMFSGGCMGTLSRTYRFTDECGNSNSVQQFISLQDSEIPDFVSYPKDQVVARDSIPVARPMRAMDNGGQPVEVLLEEIEKEGHLIRKWTATDVCGNQRVFTQKLVYREVQ